MKFQIPSTKSQAFKEHLEFGIWCLKMQYANAHLKLYFGGFRLKEADEIAIRVFSIWKKPASGRRKPA